jgi:hypothetical protein
MLKFIVSTVFAGSLAFGLAACSGPDRGEQLPGFAHQVETGPSPWTHETFDADDDKFTFGIFTDLTGGERPKIFEIAVAQLNLLRPDLIINVGDLIEGDSKDEAALATEWDWFDERAHVAIAPVFYAGGNHDLTGEMLRKVWGKRYGPTYYHFVYKNVLFLVLDTEDNTAERMEEIFRLRNEAIAIFRNEGEEAFGQTPYAALPERTAGNISAEQSEYFQGVLAAYPDVRWTFVFLHKPIWNRQDQRGFLAIEDALANRPYTVFFGHRHVYSYEERNDRDYIGLGTTGGSQFPDSDMSMDHLTLVTVSDTGVDIANLKMAGILDKYGQVPLGGNQICFEAYSCSEIDR